MKKYNIGDVVYYISEDEIQKGTVESSYIDDDSSIAYDVGHYYYSFDESELYLSIDELIDQLKINYYKKYKDEQV